MPLFEVAILELPKKGTKVDSEGELVNTTGEEKLVLGPIAVVARDPQSAAIGAVLDAKDLQVDRSRMQVLVRPF